MSTPEKPPEAEDQKPSHDEKTQLSGRPFVVGAVSFFVFAAVMYAVVWTLLQHWSQTPWPQRTGPPAPPANPRWDTQAPQVQIDPGADLERMGAAENQRLHALHWNDASRAYATIPIEDAMTLMAGAAAKNQLGTLLPAAQPATPIELQDQKSRETGPPQQPNP